MTLVDYVVFYVFGEKRGAMSGCVYAVDHVEFYGIK